MRGEKGERGQGRGPKGKKPGRGSMRSFKTSHFEKKSAKKREKGTENRRVPSSAIFHPNRSPNRKEGAPRTQRRKKSSHSY